MRKRGGSHLQRQLQSPRFVLSFAGKLPAMETSSFNAPASFVQESEVGPVPLADTTTLGAYLGNSDLALQEAALGAAGAAATAGLPCTCSDACCCLWVLSLQVVMSMCRSVAVTGACQSECSRTAGSFAGLQYPATTACCRGWYLHNARSPCLKCFPSTDRATCQSSIC
jgi:hypothetical protein